MPNRDYVQEIKNLLNVNPSAIEDFCYDVHPHTIAESLTSFSPEQIWKFLSYSDITTQARIFEYFALDWQLDLIECTGQQHIAHLIERMSKDDRAAMLKHLPQIVSDNLIRFVDEADRKDIASLIRHEPDTAGSRMTTSYAWLPVGITVREALERLRLQAPKTETIHHVYIISQERKIQGMISLERLVVSKEKENIVDVMRSGVVSVKDDDDLSHVTHIMGVYDLSVVPVVDKDRCLVGIITADDAFDFMQKESTEGAYRQAAIGTMTENYIQANPFVVWRKRVGWLACLFIAELFTFTALANFEHAIEKVVILSLFVPLCISTGGNSGSQAATLVIRAMAMGHVRVRDWFKVLWHELLMGFGLGVALGGIAFIRAALTPDALLRGQVEWWQVACAVSLAVMVICIWGTIIGSMLPIVFRKLGFDPAFASSPFVATFVDVTGIIVYFTISSVFIPILR